MRRRSCGAPRSWRLRGGRCPWPIGRSCRTLGGRVSLSGPLGSGGWRLGPVCGEEWDGVGSRCGCVLGLGCVVMFVLVCQTIARYPYRARHGMVACTPLATWSRSLFGRRRGGRSKCDSHSFTAASSLSPLCACLRLTWRPSPGCLVHVSGLVGPAPLRVVDAPNLPAPEVDSTRPLCLPWYRGGPIGACPHLKRCAPPFHCLPVMVPAAAPLAGALAPSRCFSPHSR